MEVEITAPLLNNKLPLIFDKKLNDATFKYLFGKPKNQDKPSLSLQLEYISHKANEEAETSKIGSFLYTTILSTDPTCDLNTVFNLFHLGIEKSIEDFRVKFTDLGLINYPQNKIPTLSFYDILPHLKELFSPDMDMQ